MIQIINTVAVPDIVMQTAGKESVRRMAESDSRYMRDGPPAGDASPRDNADSYRADLKRKKASDISRSFIEVFAYLTHGTASLVEARLTIITNVVLCVFSSFFTIKFIIDIMHFNSFQLDFQPADIKHFSLHTMAQHVQRAMLPGNHEVFKKKFTEGMLCPNVSLAQSPLLISGSVPQNWTEDRSLILTGQILSMP
jgi:hypothetical protein